MEERPLVANAWTHGLTALTMFIIPETQEALSTDCANSRPVPDVLIHENDHRGTWATDAMTAGTSALSLKTTATTKFRVRLPPNAFSTPLGSFKSSLKVSLLPLTTLPGAP
jgi:hypothetical protein